MKAAAPNLRPNYRYLLAVGLLAVGVYVIVPQIGGFQASWHLLGQTRPAWTLTAVIFTGLTYLAAAGTYCLLAFKRLRYWRTVLVQLAAMFINRLLPGGIGALGVNFVYLRRSGHDTIQAASVTAINNFLGAFGHWLMVLASLVVSSNAVVAAGEVRGRYFKLLIWLLLAAGVLALVLIIVFGRRKFDSKLREVREQLSAYRKRPWRLPAGLMTSMILTACNVLALACCSLALGVHLPLVASLLVLTFGVGAGTAIPTPGGLGGFEAGLVAGFVAYGVDVAAALAVALLYRLVSYWLPLAVGGVALLICQRRKFITF